jgi:hypothetical protein
MGTLMWRCRGVNIGHDGKVGTGESGSPGCWEVIPFPSYQLGIPKTGYRRERSIFWCPLGGDDSTLQQCR